MNDNASSIKMRIGKNINYYVLSYSYPKIKQNSV